MRKLKFSLLIVIVMLILCCAIGACSKDDDVASAEIVDINVKFYIGEELYSEATFKTNDEILLPDIKGYKGYTIDYWSLNDQVIFNSYKAGTEDLVFIAQTSKTVPVNFIADNNVIASYYASENTKLLMPNIVPEKENYTFKYWTLNSQKVDFPFDCKDYLNSSQIEFVAYFEKNIKISFLVENTSCKEVYIPKESRVEYIVAPKLNNKEFIYWEDENGNKVDFSRILNKDTTYTAIYEDTLYKVNYYANNGLYKTLYTDSKAVDIAYPDATYFYGWYNEQSTKTPFDFSQNITNDVNLYAKTITTSFDVLYKQLSSSYLIALNSEDLQKFNNEYLFDNYNKYISLSLGKETQNIVATYTFKRANSKNVYISYNLITGSLEARYSSSVDVGPYSTIKLKFDEYNYENIDITNCTIVENNNGTFSESLINLSKDVAKISYEFIHNKFVEYTADYDETIVRQSLPTSGNDYTYTIQNNSLNVSSNALIYSLKLYKNDQIIDYAQNETRYNYNNLDSGLYAIKVIYEFKVENVTFREIVIKYFEIT